MRIGWKKAAPGNCAVYFNCQTNLVEIFRTLFPRDFEVEANRAIVFNESAAVPADALASCIATALMYHRNKTSKSRAPRLGAPTVQHRS